MEQARYNVWLVKKGEQPLLYFGDLSEDQTQYYMVQALSKVFDGSDADGFIVTRSDYPVPVKWPNPWRN